MSGGGGAQIERKTEGGLLLYVRFRGGITPVDLFSDATVVFVYNNFISFINHI